MRPLKYHRTENNGQFALYSVGWNGTDDGGTIFMRSKWNVVIDLDRGDWVWTGQVIGGK
jgi:hypothetical protein